MTLSYLSSLPGPQFPCLKNEKVELEGPKVLCTLTPSPPPPVPESDRKEGEAGMGSVQRAISRCSLGWGKISRPAEEWNSFLGGLKRLGSPGSRGRSVKQKVRPRLTDADEPIVLRPSLVGHFHSMG